MAADTQGAAAALAKKRPGAPGDVFRIAELAAKLGLSEWVMSYIVSLGLTWAILLCGIVACLPIRVLTEAAWGPRGSSAADLDSAPPVLQGLWELLSIDWMGVTASPAFPGIFSLAYYFAACLPTAVLDMCDFQFSRKYKIQPKAMPGWKDLRECLAHQLLNLICMALPGIVFQLVAQGPWPYYGPQLCAFACTGSELFPKAAPLLLELVVHLALSLCVFDFSYGLWHMLHHKSQPLYRHIHSLHHNYFMPFSFVSQYVTLGELIPVSLFSFSIVIAMGAHPLTQWIWLAMTIQLSVEAHSGYDISAMLGNWAFGGSLVLGLSGPISHDRHHQKPRTNFFPFLSWGDKFFGTAWQDESSKFEPASRSDGLRGLEKAFKTN